MEPISKKLEHLLERKDALAKDVNFYRQRIDDCEQEMKEMKQAQQGYRDRLKKLTPILSVLDKQIADEVRKNPSTKVL